MQTRDAVDGADDLFVGQWRAAANAIPAQQQLLCHVRVHAMPEQMAGQGGNGIVALAFRHTLLEKHSPLFQAMPGMALNIACLLQ